MKGKSVKADNGEQMNFKKSLMLLVTFVASIIFVPSVFAECTDSDSGANYKITTDTIEKYCDVLADAFNDVNDNGTITLLNKDSINGSRIEINQNKTITLDLNGNTINGDVSDNLLIKLQNVKLTITDSQSNGKITNTCGGFLIADNSTITLEKGTIEGTGECGAVQVGSVLASGELIVNGGTIENTNEAKGTGINIVQGETVINDGNITSTTGSTILVGNVDENLFKGTLIVNKGTIKNTNETEGVAILLVNGDATVEGGTITSKANGNAGATVQVGSTDKDTSVSFILKGGKIINESTENGVAVLGVKGTTTIEGGEVTSSGTLSTIQVGVSKDYAAEFNITGGTIENTNEKNSTALFVPYGGCKATVNGGSIKANENAENSITVMIGHNNIADASDAGAGAKVTINKGDITGGIALFGQKPELDVTGGNITSKSFAISGNGSPKGNVNATLESTINISGGNIKSTGSAAIYHPQDGTLNVSGGTITGKLGIVARAGKVNISENANIIADGSPEETYQVGDAMKNGERVKLPGGTGVIVDNSEDSYPGQAKVTIEGGNFNTNGKSVLTYEDAENETKDIQVKGGTFNKDVDSVYLGSEVQQSESGVVGKVHKITKDATLNGSFTVNENAAEGENVKVNVEPASGYKLEKISVTYELNGEVKEVEVTDGTFIMPAYDVKVKVTFVKDTSSSDNNDIIVEETSKGDVVITLSESSSNVLKETLENTTDAELKSLLGKQDITIVLENKEITKESLTKEELAKFENLIKNGTIAEYLDLSIVVKASGHTDHYLKELSSVITLSVKLPELPKLKDGYNRKYYILREHNGVVERLDATISKDGKSLTFKSDKFSKYAIAYVDEKAQDATIDKAPNTFDNIQNVITIGILTLGALGIAVKKVIK